VILQRLLATLSSRGLLAVCPRLLHVNSFFRCGRGRMKIFN
jgi:hypothetical protein